MSIEATSNKAGVKVRLSIADGFRVGIGIFLAQVVLGTAALVLTLALGGVSTILTAYYGL